MLAAEGIAGEVARLLMVERVGVEIQLTNEIHNEEGGFFFFQMTFSGVKHLHLILVVQKGDA